MKNIIIEKATLKDINFIIKGIKEICKIEKEPCDKEIILKRKISKEIKNNEIVVAKTENELIGFMEFVFSNEEPYGVNYGKRKEKFCWVNNMYVIKKMRRKGIGKLFFKELNLICKSKKIKTILLDVFEINTKGRKFYDKVGFKPIIHIMEKKVK